MSIFFRVCVAVYACFFLSTANALETWDELEGAIIENNRLSKRAPSYNLSINLGLSANEASGTSYPRAIQVAWNKLTQSHPEQRTDNREAMVLWYQKLFNFRMDVPNYPADGRKRLIAHLKTKKEIFPDEPQNRKIRDMFDSVILEVEIGHLL
jgi:hypothetical protein